MSRPVAGGWRPPERARSAPSARAPSIRNKLADTEHKALRRQHHGGEQQGSHQHQRRLLTIDRDGLEAEQQQERADQRCREIAAAGECDPHDRHRSRRQPDARWGDELPQDV